MRASLTSIARTAACASYPPSKSRQPNSTLGGSGVVRMAACAANAEGAFYSETRFPRGEPRGYGTATDKFIVLVPKGRRYEGKRSLAKTVRPVVLRSDGEGANYSAPDVEAFPARGETNSGNNLLGKRWPT